MFWHTKLIRWAAPAALRRGLALLLLLLANGRGWADEFDDLRVKWRDLTTGGTNLSLADSLVQSRLSSLASSANSYWGSMDTSSGRTYLWSDAARTNKSQDITTCYNRLNAMALAWATRGCSLEGNAPLAAAVLDGLDWLYTNRYNETITTAKQYDNWWDWEIGSPQKLNDTALLMYDMLAPAQLTNYLRTLDNFNDPGKNGWMTGANTTDKCLVAAIRGILGKRSAKLAAARDRLSPVFPYVTSGDGFYTDGSFIQHTRHPYTGSYGTVLVSGVSRLMILLAGSTWAVTDPARTNVFRWVHGSYEPFIYKGAMMDFLRGRAISRQGSQDHSGGAGDISNILRISQFAPTNDALAFKRMINTKSLRRAIKIGDTTQVTEILRAAGKKGVRLHHGWTPLHVAVKRGKKDVVVAILEAGADINATTDMHQTPLDVALQQDHKDLAVFLCKKSARSGAELCLHGAVAAGDLKAVRKHLAGGADLDQLVNGVGPLSLALEYRHWEVAKVLLSKKCDVTKPQQWQATPLHIAAASGAPDVLLAKLLKLGAHIDALDGCHRTPLCHAARAGHIETADWLLDHGADVTRGHENDSTPVYCALENDHVELASHLIDRGGKSTLHQAVKCNHLARARQKLTAGADANEPEAPRYGPTPLEIAIQNDATDMVALLLEFGADPNQQDRSLQGTHGMIGGKTSLHEAVYMGSAKMVKLLLGHGADPDIANADGVTAIELAQRKDRMHLGHLMEADLDKKLSLEATRTEIEPLYTVQRVAELLSVDDTFILELIKARKITALKLDEKTLRITAGSIHRYLAKLAK